MLLWASNHINEVARAARASSTMINRQGGKSPGNNTTTDDDDELDSDEDTDGKNSQRRSVVLSRHSNYNKSNTGSRTRCMKFDSVKNFLKDQGTTSPK